MAPSIQFSKRKCGPEVKMSCTTRLTGPELTFAKAAFHALFFDADPFASPLRCPGSGMIVSPIRYELDRQQLRTLVAAVSAVGEAYAYVSQLEGYMGSDFELRSHWKIALPNFSYEHLGPEWSPIEENAGYSVKGTWGVIVAHEWHGIAVGPPAFLTTLRTVPQFVDSLREFLLYWKDARDRLHERTDWLPGLLANVLGKAEATRILAEIGEPPEAWMELPK